MTKIQVFIDFEAISAPFSNKLKVNNDLPYAYSYGIHKGKKFKTRTTIVNFNHVAAEDVFEYIRTDISDGLRELTGNKAFKTNKDTVKFIGWAPLLEKKILTQAFKGIEVADQTKGESISISSLTNKEYDDKGYFTSLKKEVTKKLDPEFVIRRGLNHDGALAALAGYELYRETFNIKDKWNLSLDKRTLLKEIRTYSKDDIVRMSFLHKNQSLFTKRKAELLIKNNAKQKISRRLNKLNSFSKTLETYDGKQTVSEISKNINIEIKSLIEEKEAL